MSTFFFSIPSSEIEIACLIYITTRSNAQIVIDYFGDSNLIDIFELHALRLRETIVTHFHLDYPCQLRIKESVAHWQMEKRRFWRKFVDTEKMMGENENEGNLPNLESRLSLGSRLHG